MVFRTLALLEREGFEVVSGVGVGEDGAGLFFEELEVAVTGGKVGKDELFGVCVMGDLRGLFGGHVFISAGVVLVLVEVGAFAKEHSGVLGEVGGCFAREGVDDGGEDVAMPGAADVREVDFFAVNFDCFVLNEVLHERSANAEARDFFFVELQSVALLDAPADVVDVAVFEEVGSDREGVVLMDDTGTFHWVLDDVDVIVVDRAETEAVEIFFAGSWIVAMDGVGDFIEV